MAYGEKFFKISFDVVIFLRNSRKYRLGSLRMISKEGTSPTGLGPTSGELILTLQPTNKHVEWKSNVFRKIHFLFVYTDNR